MRIAFPAITLVATAFLVGCQQSQPAESSSASESQSSTSTNPEAADSIAQSEASSEAATILDDGQSDEHAQGGRGRMGRGRGSGGGRGPGMMAGNREDMMTIHALFDARDRITRSVKNLRNGAETVTECEDDEIAGLIQEHVPAMIERVHGAKPLPPMAFHPLFIELIKHADKVDLKYQATDHGLKVTYTADDPKVVLLIQEHAKLVSRFIKNGMDEVHKPYTIPEQADVTLPPSDAPASSIKAAGLEGEWLPLPKAAIAPDDNPTTTARVELGKKLYFDPRLSLTGTVSCNTCHNLMEGGDDGRPSSMGILGRIGPRNAPTVWNSAFQNSQFWDGRSPSLEDQAKGPLLAPPEMGMPSHDFVIDRIRSVPTYVSEFTSVFGQENNLNIDNAAKAIAAFERTLITPDAPYDRFVEGQVDALSDQQVRGMKLFASVGCTECHSGPVFNGWNTGSKPSFQEFPRYAKAKSVEKYDLLADHGRSAVTMNELDEHHFKVPTLRNITLTAPYFHNGAVDSLSEAVRVMTETELDIALSDDKIADIVAFLTALEGEFPQITLPRIPSRSGETILKDQRPAEAGH